MRWPRLPHKEFPEPELVELGDVPAILERRGPPGRVALLLDRRIEDLLPTVLSLSEITAPVAVGYLERIRTPTPGLTLEIGVGVVTRGYGGHVVVEDDPTALGVTDIPVLGTLPPAKDGRYPSDLALRVVKASRRPFPAIRALPEEVWDAWVVAATAHAHAGAGDNPLLDPAVVDGLLRFGWILRQVDLHYGAGPELAG